MSYESKNMIVAFSIMIGVVLLVTLAGFLLLKPEAEIIMGQAEAEVVRISGKVPGRILAYNFEEGQSVKQGDTVVLINTPEIYAKLEQAQAMNSAAEAQNNKAHNGLRPEQLSSAYELWQKAKAGLEIAEKSYQRIQNLYNKGVIPAQKRDEAEANYKSMQATERTAHSQYQLALKGAQKEDKQLALALVKQSEGALSEVDAYLKEGALISPIDGEVSEIFPHVGELVGTGAPIMNLVNLDHMWVVFSIREDLLKDIKMGTKLKAFIPALDNKEITLKVSFIKDMGTYAIWKATKTTGQFDAKTFEVRAKPDGKIPDLRPGMSVILKK
ncbi:MAG: efflux RND transporter periplasmic adaptor subunit [Bacteroidales bacterium]